MKALWYWGKIWWYRRGSWLIYLLPWDWVVAGKWPISGCTNFKRNDTWACKVDETQQ